MKYMRMLGNYIENLSKKNNRKPSELAQLLGCSEDKIYLLYRGLAYPSISQLNKIAEFFSVSLEDILNGNEELYKKTFTHGEHSEEILDIIEDYIFLCGITNKPI